MIEGETVDDDETGVVVDEIVGALVVAFSEATDPPTFVVTIAGAAGKRFYVA